MKAALFHETGGPEVVRVEEIPAPRPGPGEIRVSVRACGLNHLDLWVRRGLPVGIDLPHVGGSDVAGVVESVGSGVEAPVPGEEVVVNPSLWCGRCPACGRGEHPLCRRYRILGEHTPGGFAEMVVVPADHAYPLPKGLTLVEAACLPVSFGTAWRALFGRAAVSPGESVLVLGASGGTALACLQLAVIAGCRVLAVTSGARSVERLQELGAERAFDRTAGDWAEEVRQETAGGGVDVVIENVGEATWEKSVRCLRPGGRLVTYGATTGHRVRVDLRALFWKQLSLLGSTMASRSEFEAMLRIAATGRLGPVIDSVVPLSDLRRAHERLEAGDHFGTVVMTVPAGGEAAPPGDGMESA